MHLPLGLPSYLSSLLPFLNNKKQVTKILRNENKGWNLKKTMKLDWNDTTTLSHHLYILCPMYTTNISSLFTKCTRHSALLTPVFHRSISAMSISNKISQHILNSNIPYRPSTAHALYSFCTQARQTMLSIATTLYIAATHNITHSPCKSTSTTHPAL